MKRLKIDMSRTVITTACGIKFRLKTRDLQAFIQRGLDENKDKILESLKKRKIKSDGREMSAALQMFMNPEAITEVLRESLSVTGWKTVGKGEEKDALPLPLK